jgi:hypothetical protein
MTGLAYAGVASVPTAGGPVPMLEFSMTSMVLSAGVALTVSQGGGTVHTHASSVAFSGNVVLYTTAISGTVSGAQVSYTPANPPSSLPSDLQVIGLVAQQVYLAAGLTQLSGLVTTLS